MPDIARKFKLFEHNIDVQKFKNNLIELEVKNSNYDLSVYDVIPNTLIEEYVQFINEASDNTIGLEIINGNKPTTINSFKQQLDIRENNKLYLDLIVKDKISNKIIAKLNSHSVKYPNYSTNIFHLYVNHNHRGLKIGEWLLIKTILTVIENIPKTSSFSLDVLKQNQHAIALVEKLGFNAL